MATTTVQTLDLAQVIVDALDGVVRCYPYAADTARVPCLVVGQPTVDYLDVSAGFCSATWTFPLTLAVARNNDRDAQRELSRLLQEVTSALSAAEVPDVFSIEPVLARPINVTIAGQELPGYAIDVNVRA